MREIDGKTRVCGLIGNPVEHTLSPVIHNTLAQRMGQDLVYVPFLVEESRVEDAVKGAYALNVLGLNVTVPHKSAVLPWVKEIDPLAEKIGAANTLVRCEDGFRAYNTDMTGLHRAMLSDGIRLEQEKVILLGAGGAARAVAFLCAYTGVEKVYLLNRTVEKAQTVANEVNRSFGRECICPMALDEYDRIPGGGYLAIQCTSVGLHPHVDDVVIADEAFYEKLHSGYDLIYKPWETRFMNLVRENGGQAYNGLKMLCYQGIHAYELWNRVTVSDEDADTVLQKMKEAMGIDG